MNKEPNKSATSQMKIPMPEIRAKKTKLKETVEPKMMEAVEKVAESFATAKEGMKQDLIAKLKSLEVETEEGRQGPTAPFKADERKTAHLTALLSSLKVDVSQKTSSKKKEPRTPHGKEEVLYNVKPVGIFKEAKFSDLPMPNILITWEKLYQKQLELAVVHPPTNGFEQMIQWTKQGKMWTFPIDNEQGMEEEAQIGFHEHVFLEPHLEPWCPRRGPIRHFMELVVVGLSKNPYMTVAKKISHINWFRDFFEEQRNILVETGAVIADATSPVSKSA
nr:EOG090X04UC [Ilyocryptus agilis]